MYRQDEKSKKNTPIANLRKSRAVVNSVSQKRNGDKSAFQFVDNRPEVVAQRKLQDMAIDSPQVKYAAQLKAITPVQMIARGGVIQRELAQGSYLTSAAANFRRQSWPYRVIRTLPQWTTVQVIDKGDRDDNFSLGGIFGTKHSHSWVRLLDGTEGWIKDTNLESLDAKSDATYDRFKGGRTGAELGISSTPAFQAGDYRRTLACYNFAVGSFDPNSDERQLQASIPEYVSLRYGIKTGIVVNQATAREDMTSGSISGSRAAAIDQLMQNAGMNIVPGNQNPDWFEGGGRALRVALKQPLQEYILRESGFEVNPAGRWAVGFRGSPTELGSDHAWLKLIDPLHPNRYITFDTFPASPRVQANRKRHADPYLPRAGEADFQINVTGPTAPQWAILGMIPSVAGIAIETDNDDRTNLHPHGY
ncbi:MAG: hypothetical protein MI799_00510 [Desulfobacterales bacterium]|nr:hypothetical protein [Desulfobacterales bacterium]